MLIRIRCGTRPKPCGGAWTRRRRHRWTGQITDRICSLYQYREAQTLLCYVSKPIEVDTIPLIQRALADGKQVACPRCVEGTRQMEFYRIHSLDDLEKRTFGVLEPRCRGVRNSPILPGACALFRH